MSLLEYFHSDSVAYMFRLSGLEISIGGVDLHPSRNWNWSHWLIEEGSELLLIVSVHFFSFGSFSLSFISFLLSFGSCILSLENFLSLLQVSLELLLLRELGRVWDKALMGTGCELWGKALILCCLKGSLISDPGEECLSALLPDFLSCSCLSSSSSGSFSLSSSSHCCLSFLFFNPHLSGEPESFNLVPPCSVSCRGFKSILCI